MNLCCQTKWCKHPGGVGYGIPACSPFPLLCDRFTMALLDLSQAFVMVVFGFSLPPVLGSRISGFWLRGHAANRGWIDVLQNYVGLHWNLHLPCKWHSSPLHSLAPIIALVLLRALRSLRGSGIVSSRVEG